MKRQKYSNGGSIKKYKSLNDLNISFKHTGPEIQPEGRKTTNNVSSLIINKPIGNKANVNAFFKKHENLPTQKNIKV